ncbi:MAG: general secretion pathway protein GspK [Deltaproteobacteria bacterium]|nr:general secretion pathway protein GspK [Deltaproteobacteria bacterium]
MTENGPVYDQNEKGFALIAVFWVSLLLSLLALNYATTARLNAEAARNRRLGAEYDYLLGSAVNKGYHEYLKYRANRALLAKKDEIETLAGEPPALWYPRFEPWICELEGLRVEIRISGEAGKFQLRNLKPELWRRIVEICGVSGEEERDTVVDAILDWIDGDSLHRLNGAETDYYEDQGLEYGCKNRDIDVIDELLLIKGVDSGLFYGEGKRPGLVDLLSPYGRADKIDINSCAPAALALVEDLPAEVIDAIVAFRGGAPITKMADLSEIVPPEYFSQLQHYFTIADSEYICVSAAEAEPGAEGFGWYRRVFAVNEKK